VWTKKRPLLSSILNPFDPLGLINIQKEFKYAYDGSRPGRVGFLAAATLLKVTLVVVQMGPTMTYWTKSSPRGRYNGGAVYPTVYLFYNSNCKTYQILWTPRIHQYTPQPSKSSIPSL
jgi:hypothetical protein